MFQTESLFSLILLDCSDTWALGSKFTDVWELGPKVVFRGFLPPPFVFFLYVLFRLWILVVCLSCFYFANTCRTDLCNKLLETKSYLPNKKTYSSRTTEGDFFRALHLQHQNKVYYWLSTCWHNEISAILFYSQFCSFTRFCVLLHHWSYNLKQLFFNFIFLCRM